MANKITKREVINAMLSEDVVKANDTYVAYLTNELALLDRKNANRKPKKETEANATFKATIKDVLSASEEPLTVSEIQKVNSDLAELSNQKVSSLLRQMVEVGEVVKVVDKKKAFFSLAA